jgi:hypothetical protein
LFLLSKSKLPPAHFDRNNRNNKNPYHVILKSLFFLFLLSKKQITPAHFDRNNRNNKNPYHVIVENLYFLFFLSKNKTYHKASLTQPNPISESIDTDFKEIPIFTPKNKPS